MTWIAFGSVPTVLVLMLAMGRLEARLLPQTPPPNGDGDPIRTQTPARTAGADAGAGSRRGLHWEVVVGPAESREEART